MEIKKEDFERLSSVCLDHLNVYLDCNMYDEASGYARCMYDIGMFEDKDHYDKLIKKIVDDHCNYLFSRPSVI